MTRGRWLRVMAALLLVVAACGGGAEDSTTTAVEDEAPEGITVDTPRDFAEEFERTESAGFGCVILARYVIAPVGFTDGDEISAVDVIAEVSGAASEGGADELLAEQNLAVFQVDDPIAVAAADPTVSPIHVLAYANHWEWAPGQYPPVLIEDLTGTETDYFEPEEYGREFAVAVIDTPFIETGRMWIDEYVEQAGDTTGWDRQSEDPSDVSHGTFIASLIRQISPMTEILLVSPSSTNPEHVVMQEHDGIGEPYDFADFMDSGPFGFESTRGVGPNDLTVLDAVALAKDKTGGAVPLNFSLGAYPCHAPGESEPFELRQDVPFAGIIAAATAWSKDFNAAAGNGAVGHPFYPGAAIGGVAAQGWNGEYLAWHDGAAVITDGPPTGHGAGAPGLDLVAYASTGVYAWGGSSFATAIVTALDSTGSNASADYSLPGLVYVNEAGEVVWNPKP